MSDLPWDEPVRFSGTSRRERLLCKLDLIDAVEALYHFKLGARKRMGEMYMRAWSDDQSMTICLEWLDTDELRHICALRRLLETLRIADTDGPEGKRRATPQRMWRVSKCSRGFDLDFASLALHMLVDEVVTHALFRAISRDSHVPLVRAVLSACAQDEERHVRLMQAILESELKDASPVRVVALQGLVIAHVVKLQNAFRPYLRSLAGATGTTTANVASEMFRAISQAVRELGTAWVRYPTARIVHGADRSAWMLWLLR